MMFAAVVAAESYSFDRRRDHYPAASFGHRSINAVAVGESSLVEV